MPLYKNPNNREVNIGLSSPCVTLTVWPAGWAPSRVPVGGKQMIELDAVLADKLVKLGMLEEVKVANLRAAARIPTPPPVLTSELVPEQEVITDAASKAANAEVAAASSAAAGETVLGVDFAKDGERDKSSTPATSAAEPTMVVPLAEPPPVVDWPVIARSVLDAISAGKPIEQRARNTEDAEWGAVHTHHFPLDPRNYDYRVKPPMLPAAKQPSAKATRRYA
jgi:hypothetical protein